LPTKTKENTKIKNQNHKLKLGKVDVDGDENYIAIQKFSFGQ
jgi:hypothetical protein